jgi:hypothetical protein
MTLGRRWTIAGTAVAVAYAVMTSFTRPFTVAADAATAFPIAAGAVITVRSMRTTRQRPPGPVATGPGARPPWHRWWVAWTAPIVAAVVWELYNLAHLPRDQHPTLSALVDMLDATRVGKTVAVAAWLFLGWFLVTR